MQKLGHLLLSIVLFFPAISACGQQLPQGLDTLFYGKQGIHTRYPALGLSIGVVRGSAVAYYALGNTQPTQGVPLDSTTLFEIGSITKTFTALLLAYEQEAGGLPTSAYLETLLPATVSLRPVYGTALP